MENTYYTGNVDRSDLGIFFILFRRNVFWSFWCYPVEYFGNIAYDYIKIYYVELCLTLF